jgi:hypothetical protein
VKCLLTAGLGAASDLGQWNVYLLLGWELHQISVSETFTYCWAGSCIRSRSVKCLLTAGLGVTSDLGL